MLADIRIRECTKNRQRLNLHDHMKATDYCTENPNNSLTLRWS